MRKLPSNIASIFCLTMLAACSESPVDPPDNDPTGQLRLSVSTTGAGAVGSLQLLVDDAAAISIGATTVVELNELAEGEHTIQVEVPGQCTSTRFAPLTVDITEGEITEASWQVRCPAAVQPGLYFSRFKGGVRSIWRTNLDGTNGVKLNTPTEAINPRMNSSRTRLAWIAADDQDYGELWVSDADGTNAVRTGIVPIGHDWSPDGRMLLMSQTSNELTLRWPDGSLHTQLREGVISWVAWSPQPNKIAFREGAYIYILDVRTGVRTNTHYDFNIYSSGNPTWSPDGNRLAFVDMRYPALFTIKSDGTDLRELHRGVLEPYLDWRAPDLLVFSERPPNPTTMPPTLRTISATGGIPTELPAVSPDAYDTQPFWAP